MCQSADLQVPALAVKSPGSPWRRFLRQPPRPKLPRSVTKSARINLNKYWNKFEEITSLNKQTTNFFISHLRDFETKKNTTSDDNAINDNLHNEKTEIGFL